MDLNKKYTFLASYFDKLNSQDTSEDELVNTPEDEKLRFFWESCMPQDIDASSILAKTQQKIEREAKKRNQRFILRAVSAAAIFLLALTTGYYFLRPTKDTDLRAIAEQVNKDSITAKEVTLITSENKLDIEENSLIQYTKGGKIAINSSLVKEKEQKVDQAEQEYDQLVVPRGKRARIKLSDGTLLWVNSQSKIVFPRKFVGNTRKIVVQGEAYLEVAHDASRPFIIVSNDFELKVLGTRFNVSNYKGMEASNIVLIEGSVEVTDRRSHKARLTPNDLLTIRDGVITEQKKVDPEEYTSWIDGIIILKGERLQSLVNRLSLYYGKTMHCSSFVDNEKVYGKLDLKDDLSDILRCIQQTVPITIQETDNEIYLSRNIKP